MLEIDNNVPLPAERKKYPFKEMNVGDSFFAEGVNAKSLRTIAWRYRPLKFSVRKEQNGVRCWRTE